MPSVVSLVRNANTIYLATHVSPDGDAIGSLLGLYWALTALGKTCPIACADAVPPSLAFLPGSDRISTQPPGGQDLIIVLDTADTDRLGSLYSESAFRAAPVVNMDHHVTNVRYGSVNVIRPKAAAVGEMIYDLVRRLGVAMDERIATCLLTAIVTDTIGFRTTSTSPRTLRLAAALMEAGASLSHIVQQSFENRPLPVLRLWGQVLSGFQMTDGIAWAGIPNRVLQQFGLREDEAKGLVNFLRGTEGTSVAVLLMEGSNGTVKVEFRSNGAINVAAIAAALGGGGHPAASGCTVTGRLAQVEQRVLAEVRRHLHEPSLPLPAQRGSGEA